jgi:2'-5' RNA ligase
MTGESQRLFIALELPLDLLRVIEKTQIDLKRTIPAKGVKWVSPSGIHLTLYSSDA